MIMLCLNRINGRTDTDMKKSIRALCFILFITLLCGTVLTACRNTVEGTQTTEAPSTESFESTTGSAKDESETSDIEETLDASSDTSCSDSEIDNSDVTEAVTSEENTSIGETEEPRVTEYTEILDYEGSKIVEYADHIKDGANAYYLDATRTAAVVENMNMTLVHGLNGNLKNTSVKNIVNSISNKNGGVYVKDTMEAFVRTTDGKTYYASDWMTGSSFNVLRGGYYYQEARVQDQGFGDIDAVLSSAIDIDLSGFVSTSSNQVGDLAVGEDGILSYTVLKTSMDPGIETYDTLYDLQISSKTHNALLITMKTESSFYVEMFFKTHKMSGYSESSKKKFSLIPGDDYHTYVVKLDEISSYNGFLTGLRFDIASVDGEEINIHSIKAVNIEDDVVPVRLDRGLHAYSDKLHQELHFVATGRTKDVAAYGMITEIDANTVEKLIVKDKNGEKNSLEGVDWASAEYIAFDIKDVGIFGYILANDAIGGSMTVTLEGDAYKIVQEREIPEGTFLSSATEMYLAHRIYTDETHSFATFRYEAYVERNPLGEENIIVEYDNMNQAKFVGYNYKRGAYEISMKGTGFSAAYYQIWNRHYTANVTVKGDSVDRKMYICAVTKIGNLECAVILDDESLMLPVPLQVIKNFAGDGEHSIFVNDVSYSETYLPVKSDSGSSQSFSILNLYQNWGKYPLKQLSWIQFASPYYHLSTGVTETNCIMPMYGGGPSWQLVHNPTLGDVDEFFVVSGKGLSTLPDFRAMSGILWKDQPQHNSCMEIKWLEYWTKDGAHIASDFVDDTIASYGPTYADITLDYISDDGKIEASYRHAEMPQTDENRTYYTIRLDVNESIDIASFKDDFNIFETNSRFGPYQKIGYLNADGEQIVEDADRSGERRFITLGKDAPYFTYFYYYLQPTSNMCNYAIIIKDWDIVIGGEKYEGNLLIEERFANSMNYTRFTLDIGEVTLKEGDYIDINLILLPWGKANDTEDLSVRQVRQDSCLAPYTVEAHTGSVIEDDYIPQVLAENNVADFTFSGGHNNGVVRVYGFDKLTSPTIYEMVDGEWVKYEVNSISNPDENLNAHYYDGYCVHYDGDGLYSYSFIIPTEQGEARRFKVTMEDFAGYPEDPSPEIPDPPVFDSGDSDALVDPDEARPEGKGAPVLYYSAQDLYLASKKTGAVTHMLDNSALKLEGDMKYATYMTSGMENQDAYIELYKDAEQSIRAGRFVGIKYRTETPNVSFELWINSNDIGYGGNNAYISMISDGEWHYAILDLNVSLKNYSGDRLYLFRFDFLNSAGYLPANSSVDIAYIGFFNSEEEAGRFELGDEFKTQEEIKNENNALCVDPESSYTLSDAVYGTNIDFVNGNKYSWDAGNSKYGVSVLNYNGATLDDGYLVVSGWSVVDGGIYKYIWSADGGKTWFKTDFYTINGFGSAGQAHYNVVIGKIGAYTFADGSGKNGVYQQGVGIGGIGINLAGYSGKIVDVVLAAVPVKDTNTVCPLVLFKNVSVVGGTTPADPDLSQAEQEEQIAKDKEANNALCVDPSSGYSLSDTVYGTNIDFVNGQTIKYAGGNSKYGVAIVNYNGSTLSDANIAIAGWTVVDGGVDRYIWSADGGKTWYKTGMYGNLTVGDGAGAAHYKVVTDIIGAHSFSSGSEKNSSYQTGAGIVAGIAINLTPYSGQTVDVIFAAVPQNDDDGICPLALFKGVSIVGSSTAPERDEIVPADPIEQEKDKNNAFCVDPSSGYTLSDAAYGTNIDAINGSAINWTAGNSKYGVSVIEFGGNTLSDGSIVIGGWTVVDGGVYKYIWSADGGKTWYKVGFHTIAGAGSGAGTAHYNVITKKIGAHTFSEGSAKNSTYQVAANTVGGIALNLTAYNGQTVDVIFAAVPVNNTETICPLVLLKGVTVTGGTTAPEKDTVEKVVKTDAEIKAENNAGLVASDSDFTVSDVVYGANLDFINAKSLSDNGGNSRYGCSRYTNEITTFSNGKLVFTGWTVVDGGVQDYVYSIDGGKTWIVIPGDPGNGAGTAHYNVIANRIGAYTFSEGSNIKSTFSGSQSQGENIAGLGINLSAYAGQTVSVTFAAIPRNDEDGLCLIAHLEKVKVVTSN